MILNEVMLTKLDYFYKFVNNLNYTVLLYSSKIFNFIIAQRLVYEIKTTFISRKFVKIAISNLIYFSFCESGIKYKSISIKNYSVLVYFQNMAEYPKYNLWWYN